MTTELVVNTTTGEVIPPEQAKSINLFGVSKPTDVIARATEVSNALSSVLRAKRLTSNIQGKEYVRVEGWTLLGSMLGVFPVCTWSRPIEQGWEARVEARTIAGDIVGAAEAQCTRDEDNWADRDEYALRSMAQTRATSKALRLPLGFVVTMAGFESTPAEEVPSGGFRDRPRGNLGVCEKHQMPFLQSAKQKAAGRPPSHPIKGTSPTQWCEQSRGPVDDTVPPTDAESLPWDGEDAKK